MQLQDITNDLILAKKAAIDSGKFLLEEKKKVNKRTNSNSKDITTEGGKSCFRINGLWSWSTEVDFSGSYS